MCGVLAICALTLLALSHADVIVYTQKRPHTIEQEFHDMPASFGPDLPFEGLRGLLTVGMPPDGCTALAGPPQDADNFTGKWIVLLARNNCNFDVKVRNAQTAGYDCAIVHNVNSSALVPMSADDPTGIYIPSVFVSDFAGQVLAEDFLYTQGYYIMVNGEMPFNINTHLLLPFAIIVALCFVILVVLMIVKCIKDRRRARRHRLPSRALKKIPICKFAKGDPYDTCAICLDDYQEGERLRVLPCSHAYHAKCIDPWLTQNRRVCPVCKRRVLAAGERRAPHSDSDSDDSREPLVSPVDAPRTQGGTFEPQRENPFVRATRFMSRLRSRPPPPQPHIETMAPEEAPAPVDFDPAHQEESEQPDDDTTPLVRPSVSEESERRRGRRGRRARSAGENRASRRHPAAVTRSYNLSINSNRERGEIGVAALPAAVNTLATPDHIHL